MVCKYKDKNGACQAVPKYLEYCHKVFFPKRPCIKEEPMTNADRIRSMTDEEMAEWLAVEVCCYYGRGFGKPYSTYANCIKRCYNWLKQEVQEVTE